MPPSPTFLDYPRGVTLQFMYGVVWWKRLRALMTFPHCRVEYSEPHSERSSFAILPPHWLNPSKAQREMIQEWQTERLESHICCQVYSFFANGKIGVSAGNCCRCHSSHLGSHQASPSSRVKKACMLEVHEARISGSSTPRLIPLGRPWGKRSQLQFEMVCSQNFVVAATSTMVAVL